MTRRDTVIALYKSGLTQEEIVKRVGYSRSTVQRELAKAGIPSMRPNGRPRKHGMSHTAEYKIWGGIIYRCTNPSCKDWDLYGGRGIQVCDEWRTSFEAFLAHVGYRPNPDMSIDRINNDGNYEPGNVQWADRVTQRANRRR